MIFPLAFLRIDLHRSIFPQQSQYYFTCAGQITEATQGTFHRPASPFGARRRCGGGLALHQQHARQDVEAARDDDGAGGEDGRHRKPEAGARGQPERGRGQGGGHGQDGVVEQALSGARQQRRRRGGGGGGRGGSCVEEGHHPGTRQRCVFLLCCSCHVMCLYLEKNKFVESTFQM